MKYLIKVAFSRIYHSPFSVFHALGSLIICLIKSLYFTFFIDQGGGRIIITDPLISIKIIKNRNAKLRIVGTLRIVPHINGNNRIVINLGSNSVLSILGDFVIGQGVRLFLSKNAVLTFGGSDIESCSGITADSIFMVFKRIEIGKDFLCAWNVFITDSDWHQVNEQNHNQDVIIGNHVWVANNSSILKGTILGNNIIVASNSKLIGKHFPDNTLIGGIPAKIIRNDVIWTRDIQ